MLLKSCNCIKIKIFFIHDSEKLVESIFQFCQYKLRKTTLRLLFTFMFTFCFKFFQTSLITKELIKHENKFNRENSFTIVFHDRENSQNSIFRIFIFHERPLKVYHEHFLVVYRMKLLSNTYFMKRSERNISQCILVLRTRSYKNILATIVEYSYYFAYIYVDYES